MNTFNELDNSINESFLKVKRIQNAFQSILGFEKEYQIKMIKLQSQLNKKLQIEKNEKNISSKCWNSIINENERSITHLNEKNEILQNQIEKFPQVLNLQDKIQQILDNIQIAKQNFEKAKNDYENFENNFSKKQNEVTKIEKELEKNKSREKLQTKLGSLRKEEEETRNAYLKSHESVTLQQEKYKQLVLESINQLRELEQEKILKTQDLICDFIKTQENYILSLKQSNLDLIQNLQFQEDELDKYIQSSFILDPLAPLPEIENYENFGNENQNSNENQIQIQIQKQNQFAKALFSYKAEQKQELSFEIDDMIKIIRKSNDGWWIGEINGIQGMIPEGYIEIIDSNNQNNQNNQNNNNNNNQEIKRKVEVIFDYEAKDEDELSIKVGEILIILKEYEGWFQAQNKLGKEGLVPANYCK
ncbi:fch and double sh3 domains protein [Anaeramoeba ignava]|uniref:Fch and double sh3 domains protein n=1 Tax=Anaeramoeba ignava TaxID=1746090 RepID=A0A9Q0LL88_ANAIG|nr:fch and double sh3 domains protein [Anaeramoeba ignava]